MFKTPTPTKGAPKLKDKAKLKRFVYIVGPIEGCYKIGHTDSLGIRITMFGLPIIPEIHATMPTNHNQWLEAYLQVCFFHCHSLGEWFRLSKDDLFELKTMPPINSPKDMPQSLQVLYEQNYSNCGVTIPWRKRKTTSVFNRERK